MKYFIGIDPGLTGAIAVLNQDSEILLLEDLPVMANGSGKAVIKNCLDAAGLQSLLIPYFKGSTAIVEQVTSMSKPGQKQGVSSVFSLGSTFGGIRAVLACCGIPTQYVSPRSWKSKMRLTSDKEQSRARAIELFPMADIHRKKDHNRAEALLLAKYGIN